MRLFNLDISVWCHQTVVHRDVVENSFEILFVSSEQNWQWRWSSGSVKSLICPPETPSKRYKSTSSSCPLWFSISIPRLHLPSQVTTISTITSLASKLPSPMQLSPLTMTLGLALVQTTSAVPAPVGALSRRTVDNLPPSDQFVACPGYRYSRHQVEMAIRRGIFNTPTLEPQPGMSTLYCIAIPPRTNLAPFCSRRLPPHIWQQPQITLLSGLQGQEAMGVPPSARGQNLRWRQPRRRPGRVLYLHVQPRHGPDAGWRILWRNNP